ncbi:MAG: hypothetical protein ABIQ15_15375 [Nocardioides sp.]
MAADLLVRPRQAVVDGQEVAVIVVVADGRIAALAAYDADLTAPEGETLPDDEMLLPGLVDTHVHVNEPGRTDWEGFASATRTAAAGVITLVDKPLNSIRPTTTLAGLVEKQRVAADQVHVDVGSWGGAVPRRCGRPGRPAPGRRVRQQVLPARLGGAGVPPARRRRPPRRHDRAGPARRAAGGAHRGRPGDRHRPRRVRCDVRRFLGSRRRRAEEVAIDRVVDAAARTGARAHIVHLADADALPAIRRAGADGVRLTVEAWASASVAASTPSGSARSPTTPSTCA